MPIDWRRRGKAARFDHGGPIRYLSLAPVAGVMLVVGLLILLSLPHKINIALFDIYGGDEFYPRHGGDVEAFVNRVVLDRNGSAYWNRTAVSPSELVALLRNAQSETLIFAPHDRAAYGDTIRVLAAIKASGIWQFCIAGLERNRRYEASTPINTEPPNAPTFEECDRWEVPPPPGSFR